jgi:outer membrane protein assembly factor BamB
MGLGMEGRGLCVFDAATGRQLHRMTMPYPVFSPPTIADGNIYVGMGNGDYVHTAEEVLANDLEKAKKRGATAAEIAEIKRISQPGGEVCCMDLATMRVQWRFAAPKTILGAVALRGDRLYFGCQDGWLYCVDRGGRLVGKWNSHAPIGAGPSVTDTHVYLINAAGMLYALDRKTLEPVWEVRVGSEPMFISSPVAARGHIYVGSQFDGLLCLGVPGRGTVKSVWPGPLGGPGRAGNPDSNPLPDTGSLAWQYPADMTGQTSEAVAQAPPAVVQGAILMPLCGSKLRGLACLPTQSKGDEAPAPRWLHKTRHGVAISPVVVGDATFVVDGKEGDQRRQFFGLDRQTGAVLWQSPVATGASGALAADAEGLFVQDEPGALARLSLDGKLQWRQPLRQRKGTVPFSSNENWDSPPVLRRGLGMAPSILVAATEDPPTLTAMDRMTGVILWQVDLEAPATAAPIVVKGTIYLGMPDGLEARRLVDGQPVSAWHCDADGVSGEVAAGPEGFLYVSRKGELILVDRDSGAVKRRVAGATAGLAPLVARDVVFYAAPGGIMRLSLAEKDAQPSQWMDTSWLGRVTAPMVAGDSSIYVGMAGWGFVRLAAAKQ